MSFKSGFITILGKPNVGKSTLLNSLVKQKISITSPKPQTTRNKIQGIITTNDYQLVFIDTPGIHKSKNNLDKFMEKSIENSIEGVDVILYIIDGLKPFEKEELEVIENYAKNKIPVILLVSKTDKTTFEKLYPKLNELNKLEYIKDIIPFSSYKKQNLDTIIDTVLKYVNEGEKFYSDEEVTDISLKFLASEVIREKALLYLQEEVPHGIAVMIDKFNETDNLIKISATVMCEKPAHKAIIIGKNGEMLKKIGQSSREELERICGAKIFLELWVKVVENWRSSEVMTNNMGYNVKKI